MTDVDHPSRPDPTTSPLTSEHANVLLDALAALTMRIEDGQQPWVEYDNGNAADPKTTATGYRDLIATADRVLTAVVEAAPDVVLVPVAASLHVRPDPTSVNGHGRAPGIAVDPGGITLAAPPAVEAPAVDLNPRGLTDPHTDGSPS